MRTWLKPAYRSCLFTTNLIGPALGAVGSIIAFTFIWNINDKVRAKMNVFKEEQAEQYGKSLEDKE